MEKTFGSGFQNLKTGEILFFDEDDEPVINFLEKGFREKDLIFHETKGYIISKENLFKNFIKRSKNPDNLEEKTVYNDC